MRALLLAAMLAPLPAAAQAPSLAARVEALEKRVAAQEDIQAVRRLAFSYGYYMDNALYDQVRSLFADRIESCEVSGYGKFVGPAGCARMWGSVFGASYGGDRNQLAFGKVAKHYLIKDVITLNPDGTADGRFDYIGLGATFRKAGSLHQQLGIYRMHFVKEGGVWKIGRFNLTFDTINLDWADWVNNPGVRCPNPNARPDAPVTPYHPFPETAVIPFHDPNPVTGERIPEKVGETRYWVGNWPGEFGGPCGKRGEAK